MYCDNLDRYVLLFKNLFINIIGPICLTYIIGIEARLFKFLSVSNIRIMAPCNQCNYAGNKTFKKKKEGTVQ